MPAIPAICNNPRCGAVFPSGFFVENSTGISFAGCESGPCPKCGSMGRVSDGTYDVLAGKISALLKNESDLAILERMQLIVESAIRTKNFKQAKAELSSANPNWKNAFNVLPEENIGNALAIYMFILAMLQTAIALYALSKPVEQNVFINQSYELFYNESPTVQQEQSQEESNRFQIHPLTRAIRNNRAF